jgi:hypothetical protein
VKYYYLFVYVIMKIFLILELFFDIQFYLKIGTSLWFLVLLSYLILGMKDSNAKAPMFNKILAILFFIFCLALEVKMWILSK